MISDRQIPGEPFTISREQTTEPAKRSGMQPLTGAPDASMDLLCSYYIFPVPDFQKSLSKELDLLAEDPNVK